MRARGMFAEVEGVPVVGDLSLAPVLSKRLKIRYAVLAMPGLDSQKLLRLSEQVGSFFTHMLIIPDLFGFGSLGNHGLWLAFTLFFVARAAGQAWLLPGLARRSFAGSGPGGGLAPVST